VVAATLVLAAPRLFPPYDTKDAHVSGSGCTLMQRTGGRMLACPNCNICFGGSKMSTVSASTATRNCCALLISVCLSFPSFRFCLRFFLFLFFVLISYDLKREVCYWTTYPLRPLELACGQPNTTHACHGCWHADSILPAMAASPHTTEGALYVADRTPLLKALSLQPEYLRNAASESGAVVDYEHWQMPLGLLSFFLHLHLHLLLFFLFVLLDVGCIC
jgi:hypothetical protein